MSEDFDRHAPDLLPLEASHALLKRARQSDPTTRLTIDESLVVAELLRDSAPIQDHPSGPLVTSALTLALEVGASFYEGLVLALAIQIDGSIVIADRPFYTKISASRHRARARWYLDAPDASESHMS